MKFTKKKDVPAGPEIPAPKKKVYVKHSAEVKQRAFELYMDIDPFQLTRRYHQTQIARILREEFKDREPNTATITQSLVSFWIAHYGWGAHFASAIEKSKVMADKEVSQSEAYEQIVADAKANTVPVDRLMKIIDSKAAALQLVDKLAPIACTAIVDLFMINQDHFKNLMLKQPPGSLYAGQWVYDCDKFGVRKQLFDMWMEGTTKLLELYNLVPAKKSPTKAAENGQPVEVDSGVLGGVNLNSDNFKLILKLFGLEQAKGGFGNELVCPNDADFPADKSGVEKPN